MKATLYLLLLLTTLCTRVRAQENATVTGQLTTTDGPAEFANVLLLATADSAVLKLELADERGQFTFRELAAGSYFLRTTGIGLPETEHPAFELTAGQTLTLPPYRLDGSATDLATVEVTAKKPFLEQKAGRLVVNVDQSITGQGGSVRDLLKKVPGVVVAGNRISMAGRTGLTILINGRPTKYIDINTLLRDMPADNIQRIEVISQPGAAYDAEGNGGVIDIILKKNVLQGTNGSAYVNAGYGERAKYRTGLKLSHQTGPLNVSGGLYYRHFEWVEGLELVRRFDDRTFIQKNADFGTPNLYTTDLAGDYDLNDRQRVGISGRYQFGDSPRTFTNTTEIISPEGTRISNFTSFGNRERDQSNLNLDAYYKLQLDTSGQELSLDASYSGFTRDAVVNLQTVGADFPDRVNAELSMARILSAQTDYKRPLTDELRFSAGAKVSRAELDNELLSQFATGSGLEVDRGLSNHFLYDEDIAAAYASLAYEKPEGISANLGLRYERTAIEGNNLTIDSISRRDYANVFPSLSVSAPVKGPIGIALSYSYRLERPSYYALNPFVAYIDPLTFQKGNPFLQPEYVHSSQFSVTYDKQPFFNLGYDVTNDIISDVTEQDAETGAAFQTTVNLDRYIRYGGSLFFPLDFVAKPISGYGGVMAYYNDYSSDYLGGQFDQDQWSVTAFLQVQAKLPRDWTAEATGYYQGAGLDGIVAYNPIYGLDLGAEKSFLDDRLQLQLSAENVVQRFFTGQIRYQEQNIDIRSTWEAPVFYFTLTYRFGNRYLKKKEGRESSAREERGRLD